MSKLLPTDADTNVKECLDSGQSFAVVAGAGSGKTTSLVTALKYVDEQYGDIFRRDAKRIACITFTNRAVDVISGKLRWDPLFYVSTLHAFLWESVKRFSPDIKDALVNHVIPNEIERKLQYATGNSQRAVAARARIEALSADLKSVESVKRFVYGDSPFSNYSDGELGHDDVIQIASYLLANRKVLQQILGQAFPFVFVDEAQDTFPEVVSALMVSWEKQKSPVVGFFGDPMQQIYDGRAGNFAESEGVTKITKEENFRSCEEVVKLLNRFRNDISQEASGANKDIDGSVGIVLIPAEIPEGPRRTYLKEQLDRAVERFENAANGLGWGNDEEVKYLFLARQMIARRQGFSDLQGLFTGRYASHKAKEEYEKGTHYLLVPFVNTIWPLVSFHQKENSRGIIEILRLTSPAFDPYGKNWSKGIGVIKKMAHDLINDLSALWENGDLRAILEFCKDKDLCRFSERLIQELARPERAEEFEPENHEKEKSDWLADEFLKIDAKQVAAYVEFITDNTVYSTQHGVKGEEYENVLVVFDDVEAAWNNYSFARLLTPGIAGTPNGSQGERSQRLAYVCFSRAIVNLRIFLFTADPHTARAELLEKGLFTEEQITIGS